MRHGLGKEKLFDDTTYSGQWCLSLKSGYGEIQYPDGTIYRGFFRHGEKCGIGIFTNLKKKDIYEIYDCKWVDQTWVSELVQTELSPEEIA